MHLFIFTSNNPFLLILWINLILRNTVSFHLLRNIAPDSTGLFWHTQGTVERYILLRVYCGKVYSLRLHSTILHKEWLLWIINFITFYFLPITQIDSYILFLYLILFSICDQRFAYFLFQLKIEIKKSKGLSSRIIFRNLIEDRDITFVLSIFNK